MQESKIWKMRKGHPAGNKVSSRPAKKRLVSWLSGKEFVSGPAGQRLKSRAGWIGLSVANGSPPLRRFFEINYVSREQWHGIGTCKLVTLFNVIHQLQWKISFDFANCLESFFSRCGVLEDVFGFEDTVWSRGPWHHSSSPWPYTYKILESVQALDLRTALFFNWLKKITKERQHYC